MGGLNPGLLNTTVGGVTLVKLEDAAGTIINPATEDTLQKVLGFQIPVYTSFEIAYNGSGNISTITYKDGITTVATKTLAYSGDDIISVTVTL